MIRGLALSALLFFQFNGEAWGAKTFPSPPQNYVYDETGVLNDSVNSLSSELMKEDQQFGNQILIAIFNSIEQEDVVDYTNRLFSTWKPGEKNKNNGAIIAVFLQERKVRIEVGYGLEPLLTDAKSKRIIVNLIGPAFQEKQYSKGIVDAVHEIQSIIHSEPTTEKVLPKKKGVKVNPILFIFVGMMILILRIIDRFTPQTFSRSGIHRNGFGGGYSSWGSSSSSGDSFGGGFSGGGGSSGGGGASGDW